jgi:hypothetical protein
MTPIRRFSARHQSGFAIVAALVLLVIASALAAFSIKASIVRDSEQSIDLLAARMEAAAVSGLEYGAVQFTGACVPTTRSPAPGVVLRCQPLGNDTSCITAIAQINTYGRPDFVQRTRFRVLTGNPVTFTWDPPQGC